MISDSDPVSAGRGHWRAPLARHFSPEQRRYVHHETRNRGGGTLIDWEIAAIAPPEADIAHWLIFDDFATSAAGVERLPGYATRDEIIGRYEATSGRRLGDVGYFEIAQALFLATTLIRQADAHVRRGTLPAGTRMGHGNALTQMLARRLGLPVPELSDDYLRHRGGGRPPRVAAEPSVPEARRPDVAAPTPKAG